MFGGFTNWLWGNDVSKAGCQPASLTSGYGSDSNNAPFSTPVLNLPTVLPQNIPHSHTPLRRSDILVQHYVHFHCDPSCSCGTLHPYPVAAAAVSHSIPPSAPTFTYYTPTSAAAPNPASSGSYIPSEPVHTFGGKTQLPSGRQSTAEDPPTIPQTATHINPAPSLAGHARTSSFPAPPSTASARPVQTGATVDSGTTASVASASGSTGFDVWPNGTFSRLYSLSVFEATKSLSTHWACRNPSGRSRKKNGSYDAPTADGGHITDRVCLGVILCADRSCQYQMRPPIDVRRIPDLLESRCPICKGALVHTKCAVRMKLVRFAGGVLFHHIGEHQHERPPEIHIAADDYKRLEKQVRQYPNAPPLQRQTGIPGAADPSVIEMSSTLLNKKRVAQEVRKIRSADGKGPAVERADLALKKFEEEHPGFIVHRGSGIISVQTPFMLSQAVKEIVTEDAVNGLLTDGAHRFWKLPNSLLISTSTYSPVINSWVPVLLTYTLGQSKEYHYGHFITLFRSIGKYCHDHGLEFLARYLLMGLDFSEAESAAYTEAFVQVAKEFGLKTDDTRALRELAEAYKKGCMEHFRQGPKRLKKHEHLVPKAMHREFDECVAALFAAADLPAFDEACQHMLRRFPAVEGWLSWWMRPRQARMLFPAHRTMDPEYWDSMPDSTNAEESLHYRYYIAAGNKQMDVIEGLEVLWNVARYFEKVYYGAKAGKTVRYGPPEPWKTVHRRLDKDPDDRNFVATHFPNDGRPPDTPARLDESQGKKDSTKVIDVPRSRPGIPWENNSCWLDTALECLNVAVQPDIPELERHISLLPDNFILALVFRHFIYRHKSIPADPAVLRMQRNDIRAALELLRPGEGYGTGRIMPLLTWWSLALAHLDENDPKLAPFIIHFKSIWTRMRLCSSLRYSNLEVTLKHPSTHVQVLRHTQAICTLTIKDVNRQAYKGNISRFFQHLTENTGSMVDEPDTCWHSVEGKNVCICKNPLVKPGTGIAAPRLFTSLPVILIFEFDTAEVEDECWQFPLMLPVFPPNHNTGATTKPHYRIMARTFHRSQHFTCVFSPDLLHTYAYDGLKNAGRAELLTGKDSGTKSTLAGKHPDTVAVFYHLQGGPENQSIFSNDQAQTLRTRYKLFIEHGKAALPTVHFFRKNFRELNMDELQLLRRTDPMSHAEFRYERDAQLPQPRDLEPTSTESSSDADIPLSLPRRMRVKWNPCIVHSSPISKDETEQQVPSDEQMPRSPEIVTNTTADEHLSQPLVPLDQPYLIDCRCGLTGNGHELDLQDAGTMVLCIRCERWSHLMCHPGGHSEPRIGVPDYTCGRCLTEAERRACNDPTRARRNPRTPLKDSLIPGKGVLALLQLPGDPPRQAKYHYPAILIQRRGDSWLLRWWRGSQFLEADSLRTTTVPEKHIVDALWQDVAGRRQVRLGRWEIARHQKEDELDYIMDPISCTAEVAAVLDQHLSDLQALLLGEDLTGKHIPVWDWAQEFLRSGRAKDINDVNGVSRYQSRKLSESPMLSHGDLEHSLASQAVHWLKQHFNTRERPFAHWAYQPVMIHAWTILLAHVHDSEVTVTLDEDLTEEQKRQEKLRLAFERLQRTRPAKRHDDIDGDAIRTLEDAMFDRSMEAGLAGFQQWGLDTGAHHSRWQPYGDWGSHPSHRGPLYEPADEDEVLELGSNYSEGSPPPPPPPPPTKKPPPRPRRIPPPAAPSVPQTVSAPHGLRDSNIEHFFQTAPQGSRKSKAGEKKRKGGTMDLSEGVPLTKKRRTTEAGVAAEPQQNRPNTRSQTQKQSIK